MSGSIDSAIIVGGGAMAIEFHLPRILGMLGSRMTHIVERNPARRDELHRRFRRNPRVQVGDAIPAATSFDLAVIATPPKFHYQYYRELQEQARSFLLEKPMTMTAEEAQRLELESREADVTVFVHLIRRTLPGVGLLRTIYREGCLGALQKVSVSEGGIFGWRAVSAGSFDRALGGGVLMDTGPHVLDLMTRVFDRIEVQAAYFDAPQTAVEANCVLDLQVDEAVPATVTLSRNRILANSLTLEFAEGTCSIGTRDNTIVARTRSGVSCELAPPSAGLGAPPAFDDLIDAFYRDHILTGCNRGVGPGESLAVARLIDAAHARATPIRGGF